jgi:hypothetical protein
LPAGPTGTGPLISFARSGLNVHWDPAFQNLLEFAEACDVPGGGRAAQGFVTAAKPGLWRGQSPTGPTQSIRRGKAMC